MIALNTTAIAWVIFAVITIGWIAYYFLNNASAKKELGSERELEGIAALLGRGNSADRQLRIFNANRDIREVVEEIAIATEALPVNLV